MPKPNLSRMDVEPLMNPRKRVDEMLVEHRVELQKHLARMDRAIAPLGGKGVARGGRPSGSPLQGRKIAPKYRSPSGDTWAGRGARPRWLVDAIKEGKKLNDFLIDKSARKARKRKVKR